MKGLMKIMMKNYTCMICGFDKLEEIPYYGDFGGSNEICSCCGFEFGVDDFDCDEFDHNHLTDKEIIEKSHILWRKKWVESNFELFDSKSFPTNLRNGNCLKREEANKQLKKFRIRSIRILFD